VTRSPVVAIILAALVGWGASSGYQYLSKNDYRLQLRNITQRKAATFQGYGLHGQAMGAVALAGRLNNEVRAAAHEHGAERKARRNNANHDLGVMADSISSSFAFVVNKKGVVASYWDSAGRPLTDRDVRFRAYVKTGLQGTPNIYGAVNLLGGQRTIFMTAPVFAGPETTTVNGVIVAEFDAERVDQIQLGAILPH
jgi:C4-dicarboxylate-specific signal transduction histidine kinase